MILLDPSLGRVCAQEASPTTCVERALSVINAHITNSSSQDDPSCHPIGIPLVNLVEIVRSTAQKLAEKVPEVYSIHPQNSIALIEEPFLIPILRLVDGSVDPRRYGPARTTRQEDVAGAEIRWLLGLRRAMTRLLVVLREIEREASWIPQYETGPLDDTDVEGPASTDGDWLIDDPIHGTDG